MKVNAIKCPGCGDVIYSRAAHDFRWCSCKEVAIDGGLGYCKVTFNKRVPDHVSLKVDATVKELYNDWNRGIDKFGLISKKSSRSSAR